MITPDFQRIPVTMTWEDQWIVWRFEHREGQEKPTKVPYVPSLKSPTRASHSNPDTWGSFQEARTVYLKSDRYDGIGFVFTERDAFCGIDFDNVIDAESGEYTDPEAERRVDTLDSYTELSPSGTGVHVILAAAKPAGGFRTANVEIYDRERYFTITGRTVGSLKGIANRQSELAALHAELFPPQPERETPPPPTTDLTMDDQAVLDRLEAARNATQFRALYHSADLSSYGGNQNSADLALCALIAFYTQDPDQVDRLFRGSALMRSKKWDSRRPDPITREPSTYGRNTVNKAIANLKDTYTPPGEARPSAAPDHPEGRPDHPQQSTYVQPGPTTAVAEEALPNTNGSPGVHHVPHGHHVHEETVQQRRPKTVQQEAPAVPFPIDCMPKSCRKLIREAAEALDGPEDLVAVPMLAALSAAIGNTRNVEMKNRFVQSASLFLCVVAPPGGAKSPSADPAMRPVEALQDSYDAKYAKAMREYQDELLEHEAAKQKARADKETPPAPPAEPQLKSMIVNDTTLEGLTGILVKNPRGVLNHQDEMTGWVRGMDQYKSGGKGNERSHWLKFYDNKNDRFDRKSTGTMIVKRPFVTVIGGIQPMLMGDLAGGIQDGLMDRILFSYPKPRPGILGDESPSREAEIAYENLYDSLMKLEPAVDEYNQDKPVTLKLTPEAWEIYKDIANTMSRETADPTFDRRLLAQWSKARGQLGRIALILAVCRFAEEKTPKEEQAVTPVDVMMAGEILRYFKAHARRVYEVTETVTTDELFCNALVDFLQEQEGGKYKETATDLLAELQAFGVPHVPDDPRQLAKFIYEATEKDPRISSKPGRKGDDRAVDLQLETFSPPTKKGGSE